MFTRDFLIEVAKGNVAGHSLVNKFGFNDNIGATLAPIAAGSVYQTPTSATSLEIVSTNSNDNASGTGARTVEVQGLDANFDLQTETVSMNATDGTIAAPLANTYTRVFRVKVATSGTYATQTGGSHVGTLTIRVSGGGATWATIVTSAGGFPMGRTEIGVYTIPAGYTVYLLSKHVSIESAKVPDVLWFRREGADTVAAPFSTMRLFERHQGAASEILYQPPAPSVVLPEKTDVGAMGYVTTGVAAVSVEFQILLVAN